MYKVFISTASGSILGVRSDELSLVTDIDFVVAETATFDFDHNTAIKNGEIWEYSYVEPVTVSG